MNRKCVLIVDDSKTARFMLAKKLAAFDIDSETRESAASAIDYLYSHTPDAVFMDYEMPGMDGYQALKIIKSNPNTATIPVMMYTSKEGGLVVSQARALGAVGVLPKQLESHNLETVVQDLHLMPDQISLVQKFETPEAEAVVPINSHRGDVEFENVKILNDADAGMPDLGAAASSPAETVFLLKRQTRIFQKELIKSEGRLKDHMEHELGHLSEAAGSSNGTVKIKKSRAVYLTLAFVAINFLLFLTFALYGVQMLEDTERRLLRQSQNMLGLVQELSAQNDELVENLGNLLGDGKSGRAAGLGAFGKTASNVDIELLEWAANRGNGFEYGVNPYDSSRLIWLSTLVNQLKHIDFVGVINLKANYGNFCLQKGETGALLLASDQAGFEECLFSQKTAEKGFAQSSYQTIEFANYITDLSSETNGSIEVVIEPDGFDNKFMPYPERYTVKTAGEWNRIAEKNQRILVKLFPKLDAF
jgi:CheY-like chemotaxis protein